MSKKKGLVSNCEDDIFISYTHVDNAKFEEPQGWIDCMHKRLEQRLFQLLGEHAKIWRDRKLNGSDIINDAIIMRLREIAILVTVLSPRYANSEWCLKELAEFYAKIDKSNPQPFQTNAPIFKVVKTPVDESKYPDELRELLGYTFYEEDQFSRRPVEFSHDRAFSTFPKFIEKIDELAWDITEFIKSLLETPSGRLVLPNNKTVYLAVTERYAADERNEIRRELQSYGYRVLPYRDFPSNPTRLREVISEDLRVSCLSIHMIGKYYDGSRDSSRSLVRLQHDLAIERSRESEFAQVIWIPRVEVTDEDQQKLIDALRDDAHTHLHIEVFEDRLEDLKTNVLSKLKNFEAPASSPPMPAKPQTDPKRHPTTNAPLEIYLINDYGDYDETTQLRKFLFAQREKIQVRQLPPISEEGQAEAVLRLHSEFLKDCDALIVFYGGASDLWMCEKENELRKNRKDRSTELLGEAAYLSGPVTGIKQDYMSSELTVISEQDKFPPDKLISFLKELHSKKAGLEAGGK